MKITSTHKTWIIIGLITVLTVSFVVNNNSGKIDLEEINNKNNNQTIGLNLGNQAPEIEMKDLSGQPLKLSSLKGKVVLIDFWASWCGPCRRDNPNVVEAANKFANSTFKNGDGFIVFSVSLDTNPNAWSAAIQKDGLFWPYHVSDLQGWSNAAAVRYNIDAIPDNVLINGDGIIIAKGIHGSGLSKTLTHYLKESK